MINKFLALKKNFLEKKLLTLSIVLSLFMASILNWSFYRYIVGILMACMIVINYKKNLEDLREEKNIKKKIFLDNLIFLLDSFIVGGIINYMFFLFTKDEIFFVGIADIKATLITTLTITIVLNLVYSFFILKLNFKELEELSIVLTLFIINSNAINGTLGSIYIINRKDGVHLIITLIIVLCLLVSLYFLFKGLILGNEDKKF